MKKILLFTSIFSLFIIGCSSDDDNGGNTSYDTLSVGDIIVSEIMVNPSSVGDSEGEWFEIYNTTSDKTFNLENVAFSNGSNGFTINSQLIISPNSYLVLSINDDTNTNGGITVDYKYANFSLGNIGGEIKIKSDNSDIDVIDYSNIPAEEGKTLSLSPNSLNATDNDINANWCISTNELPSGDYGTPKSVNTNCI